MKANSVCIKAAYSNKGCFTGKLTSRISTEFCTNVCVCMCTSVSANLPKEGSMKKPSAHSWLFPDTSVGRQGCV